MKHDRITPTRTPAGAAILKAGLTAALLRSALIELARNGYASLSMGAVARRANVGKPALYRRWKGKEELVADLLVEVGIPVVEVEDMGSLRLEMEEYARRSIAILSRPLAAAIMPDLYNEMSRNSQLGALIRMHVQQPKRERAANIICRAIARGEIPASVDHALALDMMAGPLYWRMIVTKEAVSDSFVKKFAAMVVGALSCG